MFENRENRLKNIRHDFCRILEVREAVSLGTLVQYSKTWLPRMVAPSYWKAKKDYFLSKNE